jgi:hypothetical protein
MNEVFMDNFTSSSFFADFLSFAESVPSQQ